MRFPLLRTPPGRLFLFSSLLLLLIRGAGTFTVVPRFVEIIRQIVAIGFIGSVIWLGVLLALQHRHRLAWRVRRKLIVSYVFIGFVPVALVAAFVLAGSVLLYTDVAAYVFHEDFDDVGDDVQQVAETAAAEIGRTPALAPSVLARKYENLAARYPSLSLVALPAAPVAGTAPATAGPWQGEAPPSSIPATVAAARQYRGLVINRATAPPSKTQVWMRSAVFTPDGRFLIVADMPVDQRVVTRIRDKTGMLMSDVTVTPEAIVPPPAPATGLPTASPDDFNVTTTDTLVGAGQTSPFQQTVVSVDFTDWQTGAPRTASIQLDAPISQLYERLVSAQQSVQSTPHAWRRFVNALVVFGVMLLIVQGMFFWGGIALARQITSAVHELVVGTERIQQGDFRHRITVASHDQLGNLADRFNRMSASVEHMQHVEREKQRLDDELRIAREIQKSLLPVEPPQLAGLSIAALCEPAREVGGDYYDFFDLGPRQLGVLVADVSGKGTSAALYMAELKGLMLALSHTERSPRQLLINVNHLLAAHLDNRSFITATYAVIDLEARTLTCARAGHTPLIVVSNGQSEVLIPDGMVLGLRLPGAGERFERMLEEHTRPLVPGDAIVLYTDGVTEAMDTENELFGDAALARVLAGHHTLDASGMRERVLCEVQAFVGQADPHDDMTMVILKLTEDVQA